MARASLFSSLLLLSEVLSASSETSPIKDIQSNDESSSRRDFQPVAMENLFCEEIDGIFMDGFECTCSLVTFDCQGEESICVTGPENESDFCGSFSYTGELTVEGPTSLEFHINISITKAIRQGKELEDSTVTATMCTGNTNELELCGCKGTYGELACNCVECPDKGKKMISLSCMDHSTGEPYIPLCLDLPDLAYGNSIMPLGS